MKQKDDRAYRMLQAVYELAVNDTNHVQHWTGIVDEIVNGCGGAVSITYETVKPKPRTWVGDNTVTLRIDGGASEYTYTGLTAQRAGQLLVWVRAYLEKYRDGDGDLPVRPFLVTYPHGDGVATLLVLHQTAEGAAMHVTRNHWKGGVTPCAPHLIQALPVLDHTGIVSGMVGMFKPHQQVVGATLMLSHPDYPANLQAGEK